MKQQVKAKLKKAAPWLVFFALLAGFAALRGLDRAFTNSYDVMNGDWQNYNPVRRLLAGQRPFEDFTVYLGAGELYSVAAVLLLVGNSFGRSMFATNCLTWFFFELLAFAAALAVFPRAKQARVFTLAACTVCFATVTGRVRLPALAGLLQYAAANGNSARMIRSGGLSLAVLVLAAGVALWQKSPPQPGAKNRLRRVFPLHPAVLAPLAAGAFVPWSNDMGAALYLALSLAYGLLLLRRFGGDLRRVALWVVRYIGISLCGLGASVLLVSGGHPFAWLRQTRGAGAYQAWYYGSLAEAKLTSLTQLELDGWFWGMLALAVGFGTALFLAKTHRGALQAAAGFALCLAMALWNLLYCLLSGSNVGPAGGAQALGAVLLPALAVRGAWALCRRGGLRGQAFARAWLPRCCALGAATVVGLGSVQQLQARQAGRSAEYSYLPALGAWLGDQAEKLATEEAVAAGRTVWGTYAGALESMTGQFQPGGTDYIIHVLGDAQRQRYLQAFAASGVDLVETPSFKISSFERWSRNANWWFYRVLYQGWAPVNTTFACGGMHIFWQRTGADGNLGQPTTVTLAQESPARVTLRVQAQDPAFCGVADVHLDYAVEKAPALLTDTYLRVEAVTEKQLCQQAGRESQFCDFFIPAEKTGYNIPVVLWNGAGTVALEALPENAALTVAAARVEATYFDWEYFYE